MQHSFNVRFAQKYGIEEAIIVHNLYFWLQKNLANGKHIYNGRVWTYNSNAAFSALFPYINKTKIFRVLKNLEESGVLLKGLFNENKMDKTLWYAFSDFGIEELSVCGYAVFDFIKMNHRDLQNEPTIPYNNNIYNKLKENIEDKSSIKEIDEFVEKMYSLYPTHCPKRGASLGKTRKDKERIRKLLKVYSVEEIERVFKLEIESKLGKSYMQNFSTFLNNFPDPTTLDNNNLFGVLITEEPNDFKHFNEELNIDGQIYR